MATKILRPTANYSIEMARYGDTLNWECVDDVTADDDTTYVKLTDNNNWTDLYQVPDTAPAGVIVSVTVYMRVRHVAAVAGDVNLYAAIRTHSTTYLSDSIATVTAVSGSYSDKSNEWATNPNTGLAWTQDEINAMQIGLKLLGSSAANEFRCTQVYAEILYRPVRGLSLRLGGYPYTYPFIYADADTRELGDTS